MPLKEAYIVPHPPLLVEAVGKESVKDVPGSFSGIKNIAERIAAIKPQTIVLTSPHAPYLYDRFFVDASDRVSGSFARFGAPHSTLEVKVDTAFVEKLRHEAKAEGIALSPAVSELDHGTLVPLSFISEAYSDFTLVRIGLSEKSKDDHVRLGRLIRRLLDQTVEPSVFIASGDLSHYLKSEGPYGYREEGQVFDDEIVDIVQSKRLERLLDIPSELIDRAGQCGYPSLLILHGVLGDDLVDADMLAYENTFGVGYLTARLALS